MKSRDDDTPEVRRYLTILHKRGADVILSGKRANRGIRQFIVGTGGAPGVLKLRLGSGFFRWKFVPVANKTFTDSGKDRCH